jgi:hypothetical protein
MANKDNLLPSIPDYYRMYVDPKVDLNTTPSQPCPFHNEKVGKSFSFSKQLGKWRCFGQCHCGGGVIELHQLNYRLKTKEDARKSLYQLCGIDYTESISFEKKEVSVDIDNVYRRRLYSLAVNLAKDPDSWLELDYILSKVPYDVKELEVFCSVRGHVITNDNN